MAIYPRDFFEAEPIPVEPGTCFVLMPFGEPYDEIYNEVLKECLAENHFTPLRADELYGSNPIMEGILRSIEQSELVVADLTGRNPNVFYELGIAHMRKANEKVLVITQDIGDVPFDLRPYRALVYQPTITGAKSLRTQLSEALRGMRMRPFIWSGEEWRPLSPNWTRVDEHRMRADVRGGEKLAMAFRSTPVSSGKWKLRFRAVSTGPEVNVMFCADGRTRYSGYHVWLWQGGTKLRRAANEVELNPNCQLHVGASHEIEVDYDEGHIVVRIDDADRIVFQDDSPLHIQPGLDRIGVNCWAHANASGRVEFTGFQFET